MLAIELRRLSKRYGAARGIEEISVAIPQGEMFGFVGPSGAGKSTLLRTLMGLMRPSAGQALVFGLDVQREGVLARQHIGYMPSRPALYEEMRVAKLLRAHASRFGAFDKSRAQALLERFALDPNQHIGNLSDSLKRALTFAMALCHAPDLLLLDDPLAGLDPLTQRSLIETLRQENEAGVTIAMTSQSLGDVQRLGTRAGILHAGRLLSVEDVPKLSSRLVKRVRMHFSRGVPDMRFSGVLDPIREDDAIRFLYTGDIAELLRMLTALAPDDFSIDEPPLTEAFPYYGVEVGA